LGTKAATTLNNLASVAINTTLVSDTDNTDALGTTAIAWSDLFLGNGGVITWNSAPSTPDITLTHSANLLTLDGGSLALGTNSITMTGSLAATGARVTKGWFADIESTNMITVGGTSLASTFSPIAGSASIVTVGTIATGVWNGTDIAVADGGTGAGVKSTAFDNLAPTTTKGDIIICTTSDTNTRLAGNTTTTKNFLTSTGTGAAANNPAWGTIVAGDLPAATTSAQGAVELAITSEIDTGTDTTRAMPVDQFVASNRNVRYILFRVKEKTTDWDADGTTTVGGDLVIPFTGTIVDIEADVDTAGTTGTAIVDVNLGGATIMTTNKLKWDSTEKSTRTYSGTAPGLTTTAVTAGDIITVDIDTNHTTKSKGLTLFLAIRLT